MDKTPTKQASQHNKLLNSQKHRKLVKDSIESFQIYNNTKVAKNRLTKKELSQIAQSLALPMETESRRSRE